MNIMEINMATAQDYINDYLTNSSMNPSDWDVYWAASDMIDFMTANNIEDYDDGPDHSLRRRQWIPPFVKGPADKPLVCKETVRIWKR